MIPLELELPIWILVAVLYVAQEIRFQRVRVNEHGAVIRRGTVLGWVRAGGCENGRCLEASRHGLRFHAVPRWGTLPRYHYLTRANAIAAVVAAAPPAV